MHLYNVCRLPKHQNCRDSNLSFEGKLHRCVWKGVKQLSMKSKFGIDFLYILCCSQSAWVNYLGCMPVVCN